MKLQLNHIQHYPIGENGLKVKRVTKYDRDIGTENESDITTLDFTILEIMAADKSPHWTGYPILHPLSDLTKPITVPGYNDGKEFVPREHDLYMRVLADRGYINGMEYHETIKLLYQWHFDLEGLIPASLAIDINTL